MDPINENETNILKKSISSSRFSMFNFEKSPYKLPKGHEKSAEELTETFFRRQPSPKDTAKPTTPTSLR